MSAGVDDSGKGEGEGGAEECVVLEERPEGRLLVLLAGLLSPSEGSDAVRKGSSAAAGVPEGGSGGAAASPGVLPAAEARKTRAFRRRVMARRRRSFLQAWSASSRAVSG